MFKLELMFLQVMKLLFLLSSAASVKLELLGLRTNWPWCLRSLPGRLLSFQHRHDNVTSTSWYFFSGLFHKDLGKLFFFLYFIGYSNLLNAQHMSELSHNLLF